MRAASRNLLVAVALAALSAGLGCMGLYESIYPLTAQAHAVRIVPSGQATSVSLDESCRRRGAVETVLSEHFARRAAAESSANVAQVLSVTTVNGQTQRMDVRFWRCPEAFALSD